MIAKRYYFTKHSNGNVNLFDFPEGRILKSFAPNSTIEKIDDTRIAIVNEVGSDKKFVFDYRKVALENCVPEIIGTDFGGVASIEDVIIALSTDFFFLTKSGGSNKIIDYSFRNLAFGNPLHPFSSNWWFSNNLIINETDTQFQDDVIFMPIDIDENDAYPFTDFEFIGNYGVYKNTLKEESYVKRMVVDLTVSAVTVYTNLELLLHQHSFLFHPSNSGLCVPANQKKVLEAQMLNDMAANSRYRFVFDFDKPAPPVIIGIPQPFAMKRILQPNSKLALLVKSANNKDGVVFPTMNIQLELEKM